MSAIFVCDACGKQKPAIYGRLGDTFKPATWFQRSDPYKSQHACSRECIDKIAKATGKTNVVLPI